MMEEDINLTAIEIGLLVSLLSQASGQAGKQTTG